MAGRSLLWRDIGAAIFVAVALMAWFALSSRRATTVDLGVAVFAATSFVVPIVARLVTANDIELRVMSPILIPLVYFAAVTFDRVCTTRGIALVGTALLGWWMYQGAAFAARFPDLAPGGSGNKAQFSPQLYDVIDALPAHSTILTNNPQRVWWFTDREPTVMGFTEPRPGNSHYPLECRRHRESSVQRARLPGLVRRIAEFGRRSDRAAAGSRPARRSRDRNLRARRDAVPPGAPRRDHLPTGRGRRRSTRMSG